MSTLSTPPRDEHRSSGEQRSSQSTHSSSRRSLRNWYHRTLGRSIPESPVRPALSQLRSFVSVKQLAKRTSRQALKPIAGTNRSDGGGEEDGEGQTTPVTRLPGDPNAPRCRPPTLLIQDAPRPSLESLTPDHSGLSHDISQPQTPASTEALQPFINIVETSPSDRGMGNSVSTASAVIRKPLPSTGKGKQKAAVETSHSDHHHHQPPSPSSQVVLTDQGPPPVLRRRTSTVQVPIPRRRSSLTTLHLDRSHFGSPASLQHGKVGTRASSFSETLRPTVPSLKSNTSKSPPHDQGNLSPPLLSPPLSNSRPSTASSTTQSAVSPGLTHIHLPPTFPNGQIITPVPPLTKSHYHCYQAHKRVRYSQNKIYPVPCMACGLVEGDSRWKCIWCALRICGGCMAEFDGMGRSLDRLMDWLAKQEGKKKSDAHETNDKGIVEKSGSIRQNSTTSRGKDGTMSSGSGRSGKASRLSKA